MSANTTSRETVRDALAALLATALVGTGLPVQAVYNYQVSDFGEKSPVVLVLSGGAKRKRHGLGTAKWHSWLRLEVLVFVAEASITESWTDQNVDDILDDIEKRIADVIADHRASASWSYIEFADEGSRILPARTGGKSFKLEAIPVIAEVVDA